MTRTPSSRQKRAIIKIDSSIHKSSAGISVSYVAPILNLYLWQARMAQTLLLQLLHICQTRVCSAFAQVARIAVSLVAGRNYAASNDTFCVGFEVDTVRVIGHFISPHSALLPHCLPLHGCGESSQTAWLTSWQKRSLRCQKVCTKPHHPLHWYGINRDLVINHGALNRGFIPCPQGRLCPC